MRLFTLIGAFFTLLTASNAQDETDLDITGKRIVPLKQAVAYSECQCGATASVLSPSYKPYPLAPALLDLPIEISTICLSYVPFSPEKALNLVSKDWYGYGQKRLKECCIVVNDTTIKTVPPQFLENIGGIFFNLSKPSFSLMVDLLSQTKNLRYLGIRFTDIKVNFFSRHRSQLENPIEKFFNALKTLDKIQFLDLSKTQLRLFDYKINTFPFIPQLQLFNGAYNTIAQKGATYQNLFKKMTGIQVISLQGIKTLQNNHIADLSSMAHLGFINMNGTRVTKKFVEELKKKVPSLVIYFEPYVVNRLQQVDQIDRVADLLTQDFNF